MPRRCLPHDIDVDSPRIRDGRTASDDLRLLQPREFGGRESSLSAFLEAVVDRSQADPDDGHALATIGAQPQVITVAGEILCRDVWAADPEARVGVCAGPGGVAESLPGGFELSGSWSLPPHARWCDWMRLGARIAGNHADRGRSLWLVVPRSDYRIDADKQRIVVASALVPMHRALDPHALTDHAQRIASQGLAAPIYGIPPHLLAGAAMAAHLVGLARGVTGAYRAWVRTQASGHTAYAYVNPYQRADLAAAAADVDRAWAHIRADADRLTDMVLGGAVIAPLDRAEVRRNQVRAAQWAGLAAQRILAMLGDAPLDPDETLAQAHRWITAAERDSSSASDEPYFAYGMTFFGHPLPRHLAV